MHTVWLNRDEVLAYGRDFLGRIADEESRPEIWCAITASGFELATELITQLNPTFADEVTLWTVGRVHGTDEIVRLDEAPAPEDFTGLRGRRVLIIDSAIHSGETFSRVHARIANEAPASIVTYSLVVKRSSGFYPTYWGCTLNDSDRAYFLLNSIPNNRLSTGNMRKDRNIRWSIRRMSESDCTRPPVKCGLDSIDRMTWDDRFYSMRTNRHGLATFLCEIGLTVAGFLTFHYSEDKILVIDEVAVSDTFHNSGAGGMLVRFAETQARQANQHAVRLWAVAERVEWYGKRGYKAVDGTTPVKCGTELFSLMEKDGLYRTFFEHAHT